MSEGTLPPSRQLDDNELVLADRMRAVLASFQRRWQLPLNPDDLDEVVYALITLALEGGDASAIADDSDRLIDDVDRRTANLTEAMQQRSNDRAFPEA